MEKRKQKNDSNDNPFSFRNFLTTPSGAVNNNETSSSNSTTSTNHTVNSSYSVFSNRHRDGNERQANPYSFARFLQNPVPNTRVDNGLILQGELPDFVQDHFVSSNADSSHRNGLPDFTFHTHNDQQCHDSAPPLAPISPASSPEDLFSSRLNDDTNRIAISTSANLPDFLSDTGINIISKDNDTPMITDTSMVNVSLADLNGAHFDSGDYDIDELSNRITQLEHESSQKTNRIHQLEQQLAEQKRKESEDTEAMETMMRQVGDNLEKAVERWQKSEVEVERLTSKVRKLESRLSKIQLETSQAPMHLVQHIGAQLSQDLSTADNIMRQFLEHSDKMKMLAGHLQCLDRVEDAQQTQSDTDQCKP